jgi:hypothetical protein
LSILSTLLSKYKPIKELPVNIFAKPVKDQSEGRRMKMLIQINTQLLAVQADIDGKPFTTVTVKGSRGGETEKRVQRWFRLGTDGLYYCVMRNGTSLVELDGHQVYAAKNMKEVQAFFIGLKTAVESKELDAALAASAPKGPGTKKKK